MPKKEIKVQERREKTAEELNKILLENFVILQKTLTNLALKFDNLSGNISKLLQLFEMSARSFAEKPQPDAQKDKEFLDKINMLLEQNKTIAKGLTLMEEKIRQRVYGEGLEAGAQFPQRMPIMPPQVENQPSMESKFDKFKKLPRF